MCLSHEMWKLAWREELGGLQNEQGEIKNKRSLDSRHDEKEEGSQKSIRRTLFWQQRECRFIMVHETK